MSPEDVSCFKLLDGYARSAHSCFLTEFFRTGKSEGSYLCCFRPLGEIDAADRCACKYVAMSANQIQSIPSSQCVPADVAETLDEALAGFTK